LYLRRVDKKSTGRKQIKKEYEKTTIKCDKDFVERVWRGRY
jgi:hypothetical protein